MQSPYRQPHVPPPKSGIPVWLILVIVAVIAIPLVLGIVGEASWLFMAAERQRPWGSPRALRSHGALHRVLTHRAWATSTQFCREC